MVLLRILLYPNPILRKKCKPVEEIDGDVLKLLDDMADTMYEAPGVGLAAPQVGVNKRVIVADTTPKNPNSKEEYDRSGLVELINPEIVFSDGEAIGEEGCLSVPGFLSNVKRKASVVVDGYDRGGNPVQIDARELMARVLQHEIDHLDGVLFFDRLERLKRELLKRQIDKALGKGNKV